jgi:hypothetical protein
VAVSWQRILGQGAQVQGRGGEDTTDHGADGGAEEPSHSMGDAWQHGEMARQSPRGTSAMPHTPSLVKATLSEYLERHACDRCHVRRAE